MVPLRDGDRYHVLTSTYGGVAQRWVLIYSAPRRPQAQRPVDTPRLKQRSDEVNAFQKLCRTAVACEAAAQQALSPVAHGLHTTALSEVTIRAIPRSRQRGRPAQGTHPDQVVYQIEGALASSIAAHEALVAQQRWFILATNELDDTQFPPQEVLEGSTGQKHAERGFRFLKEPRFLASTLYRKKPERLMAFLMVMTVCWLVYAALEYRIRQALKADAAMFPNQTGHPIQNPTARWVFQYFGGIHLLLMPGQWPLVLNLTETHAHLLRLLGQPYKAFYS
jgi:transposase